MQNGSAVVCLSSVSAQGMVFSLSPDVFYLCLLRLHTALSLSSSSFITTSRKHDNLALSKHLALFGQTMSKIEVRVTGCPFSAALFTRCLCLPLVKA